MKFGATVKFVRPQFVSEGGPVDKVMGPDEASRIYMRDIVSRPEYDKEVEQFSCLYLDVRNQCKAAAIISKGIANMSLVHAREVFRPAIACGASTVVLLHNHPTGDTSPSPADLKVTRDLVQSGKILDIKVMDHIVMNDGELFMGQSSRFLSMRESGLVSFA